MTATTPTRPTLAAGRTLRLGFSRIVYELRIYFRAGDAVFFTFLFPLVMLTIFSVAFSNQSFGRDAAGNAVSAATFYLPAMLAAGILLSGIQNLGVDIAGEKGDGTLKRLGGSPLPVFSYFIGKIGQVIITGILQSALLLLAASLLFGVKLPTDSDHWLTFAWVFLLGIVTCAVLGIAVSALPRTGKSATAVIIPITLVLQFISGVYLSFTQLPAWLQNVASVFPLKWLAQAMRSVFLPDTFKQLEAGHSWDLNGVLIVTLIWLVAGLIACRVTFRWIHKDS